MGLALGFFDEQGRERRGRLDAQFLFSFSASWCSVWRGDRIGRDEWVASNVHDLSSRNVSLSEIIRVKQSSSDLSRRRQKSDRALVLLFVPCYEQRLLRPARKRDELAEDDEV